MARDRSDFSIITSDDLYNTAEMCSGLVSSVQCVTEDSSVYLTTAVEEMAMGGQWALCS